jgi:hypothetical protein
MTRPEGFLCYKLIHMATIRTWIPDWTWILSMLPTDLTGMLNCFTSSLQPNFGINPLLDKGRCITHPLAIHLTVTVLQIVAT